MTQPGDAFAPGDYAADLERCKLALDVTRQALEWNLADTRGLQSIVEKCRALIRSYRRGDEGRGAQDTLEHIAHALTGLE